MDVNVLGSFLIGVSVETGILVGAAEPSGGESGLVS